MTRNLILHIFILREYLLFLLENMHLRTAIDESADTVQFLGQTLNMYLNIKEVKMKFGIVLVLIIGKKISILIAYLCVILVQQFPQHNLFQMNGNRIDFVNTSEKIFPAKNERLRQI